MNLLETLMNKENMKNLFQNDPEIGPFLVHITMSLIEGMVIHLKQALLNY